MSNGSPAAGLPAVLLNDTRNDAHHGCDRVVGNLLGLARRHGIEVIATAPAHADWRQDGAFAAAFERARLVLVNGEGTIHHDRPAGLKLLEAGREARSRGVPAVLLNCTWQANGPEFVARLRDFAQVSVRESLSEAELKGQGVACTRVPDLSLYGDTPPQAARQGLGFTDSVLRDDALALLRAGLRYGAQPCPIQYPPPGATGLARYFRSYFGKVDLRRPGQGLARLADRCWQLARRTRGQEAYLAGVARLELLISGRFHSDCFALLARTPLLAAESNSHKVQGLLADAGLEPWRLVEPAAVNAALIARARTWTPPERARLDDFIADAQRRIAGCFAAARALA